MIFAGPPNWKERKRRRANPFTQNDVEYAEGWDACVECAILIDRDDWDGLFERTEVGRGILPEWKDLSEDEKQSVPGPDSSITCRIPETTAQDELNVSDSTMKFSSEHTRARAF